MSNGGRYLKKDSVKKTKKSTKIALIILGVLAVLIIALVIGVMSFVRHMTGFVSNDLPPVETTAPTTAPTEPVETQENQENTEPTVPETTDPLETWPEIVSTQNVTNIMLVGQNYRYGEENKLADTMILCSINRETKTLTMTSFMRDLYVTIPAYAGHSQGRNRMNVCYNLGWSWTGNNTRGGMEMLALAVEQNFGIPVHHTIEVDFDFFEQFVDALGGVDVTLTEAEAEYLTGLAYTRPQVAGPANLNGWEALCYARCRSIDSDFGRTNRQRTVIASLIDKCRQVKLMDLYKFATDVLPAIVTDMTTDQMNDYIWEFLPMLADLKIVSQSVPLEKEVLQTVVPGAWSYKGEYIEKVGGNVLTPNLPAHKEFLQQQLGFADAE